MQLKNYKVTDNGIWISKEDIENLRNDLNERGKGWFKKGDNKVPLYYFGMADVFVELLERIENDSKTNR